jgi:uncharacterized protein YaaQ
MKLLISVINRSDTRRATQALVDKGYTATIINTTSGFLREGNATLLIEVADEDVARVLDILRAACRERIEYARTFLSTPDGKTAYMLTPTRSENGGSGRLYAGRGAIREVLTEYTILSRLPAQRSVCLERNQTVGPCRCPI